MSIGVLHGQTGGAGLAVKVVGGTQKPSNAKQGVIWVNTDQKITGWTMQAEEPAEPNEGMVWVGINTVAKLNAAKKNGLWVTPAFVKQYEEGAWVKKTGEYYNNGKWSLLVSATIHITYPVGSSCTISDGISKMAAPDTNGTWDCVVQDTGDWVIEISDGTKKKRKTVKILQNGQDETIAMEYVVWLYQNGDECAEDSGGWQAKAKCLYTSIGVSALPSISKNSDHLYAQIGPSSSSSYRYGIIETQKDADLTGYDILEISCKADTYSAAGMARLIIAKRETYDVIAYKQIIGGNSEVNGTFTLNIPDGVGNVAVIIELGQNGSEQVPGYAKIWMYSLKAY